MLDAPRHLAVHAPNWIGDAVMATPALRCLREGLPGARITLAGLRGILPVFRACPWIDATLAIEGRGLGAMLRAARALRADRPDAALVLPDSFRSALLMRLGGARRLVGYRRDARSWLLSTALPRPSENGRFKPTYMADYYLALTGALGLAASDRRPRLFIDEASDARAAAILRAGGLDPAGRFVLLAPGASFGPAKRWPADRFALLADMLREQLGWPSAIVCGPADRAEARGISAAARTAPVDLSDAGVDLHLLKGVVRRCSLMVCTDSGPRHYAVAFDRPTVCIMGPTRPAYSTTGLDFDRVVRADVACGPCQRGVCRAEHRCMLEISPRMVLDECLDLLRKVGTVAP